MTENNLPRQIAFELKKKNPELEYAWVVHAGIIYYSSVTKSAGSPFTAVTQLIQHLFDSYVDHSFFILRNRIFTTEPAHPYSQGMVRLTAKRITFSVEPLDFDLQIQHEFKNISSPANDLLSSAHLESPPSFESVRCTTENANFILGELIQKLPKGPVLHDYNRRIAAVLTDRDGNILEYSPNQNSKNKTLHAELLMLQNYFRRTGQKIPSGSQIFVSLKPCKMCAAAILQFAEEPGSIHVYYLEDDPGTMAHETELEKTKQQTQL